ncbi:sigma-70 family RNA polymerase sigma factor [Acidipila sp. EB88]|uniref:sigma-70 family RNA polymerase sigma factor n=1 Tax=Acidipila sp. EB88 TaxID=2305226 RepID=UPI000F5DC111|nr:sigma-70 family RNA polymerase sigma factor [Acidipila sp. EB88]RRA49291.1 sigma-70 family RNA polymerase sigma factor [Acidipila sp. EB88]
MSDLHAKDEQALIVAILAGDTRLFHDLIRPHERRVFLVAMSLVKSQAEAEDVAQEAFLKAFRNLATFRAEATFATWLTAIALNEARSRLRSHVGVRVDSLDSPEEEGGVSPALLRDWREIPSEALERKQMRDILRKAIEGLPRNYRDVFMLRDVEGLNGAEVAQMLGLSGANVKVRLHRARLMLQRELAPQLKTLGLRKRSWWPWS